LETALQECEMKNRTLKQRIIDNNSPQLLSLREQNTKLMREVDKKGGYVRLLETSNELLREKSKNFETELQDVKKTSVEKIRELEKDLEAEKNVRIELEQSKASLEQQVKNHNDQHELRKIRQSRNKYQTKALALENEVKALKLDTASAKTNEDTLNDRIRQLRKAAVIVHDELATERIATAKLSNNNEELNQTVLAMKRSLGSLADQWGVGSQMSNHISNNNAPSTPIPGARRVSSMSVSSNNNTQRLPVTPSRDQPPVFSSSNNNIQTTPVAPFRHPESSILNWSNNNIQGTLATQPRKQSSPMSENNNSNNATSGNRKRSNPRPPTDREKAHINLDKLSLQLLQEFNEAWKKADTMIPFRGFTLVHPVSASNMHDIFGKLQANLNKD
jgi:predicted  nucleic acid-binding Zn-ribbon protein